MFSHKQTVTAHFTFVFIQEEIASLLLKRPKVLASFFCCLQIIGGAGRLQVTMPAEPHADIPEA
jgi:hypothetical protein